MTRTFEEDGIEYTLSNHRMRYNPEFHENHGKPFTVKELAFMCSVWDSMKKADIAMALGRTHGTVLTKVYGLKKAGRIEHYKKLGSASKCAALTKSGRILCFREEKVVLIRK